MTIAEKGTDKMSDEVKKGRGRPARYGKGNELTAVIVGDLQAVESGQGEVTMYYVQKLMDMGFVNLILTPEGEKFLADNQ